MIWREVARQSPAVLLSCCPEWAHPANNLGGAAGGKKIFQLMKLVHHDHVDLL